MLRSLPNLVRNSGSGDQVVKGNGEKVLHALCLGGVGSNAQLVELTGLAATAVQDNLKALDKIGYVTVVESRRGRNGGEPKKIFGPLRKGLWAWLCNPRQTINDIRVLVGNPRCKFHIDQLRHILGLWKSIENLGLGQSALDIWSAINPLELPAWRRQWGDDASWARNLPKGYDLETCDFYFRTQQRRTRMEKEKWRDFLRQPGLADLRGWLDQSQKRWSYEWKRGETETTFTVRVPDEKVLGLAQLFRSALRDQVELPQ